MQLDISAKLTPQVTTIMCHHMKKKILLKKEKRKKIQKYGGLFIHVLVIKPFNFLI